MARLAQRRRGAEGVVAGGNGGANREGGAVALSGLLFTMKTMKGMKGEG